MDPQGLPNRTALSYNENLKSLLKGKTQFKKTKKIKKLKTQGIQQMNADSSCSGFHFITQL